MTLLGSCSMKDVQDKARVGFVIHYSIDIPISLRTGQLFKDPGRSLCHLGRVPVAPIKECTEGRSYKPIIRNHLLLEAL